MSMDRGAACHRRRESARLNCRVKWLEMFGDERVLVAGFLASMMTRRAARSSANIRCLAGWSGLRNEH